MEAEEEEDENLARLIVLRVVRARLGNRFGVFSGEDGVFRRGDVRHGISRDLNVLFFFSPAVHQRTALQPDAWSVKTGNL